MTLERIFKATPLLIAFCLGSYSNAYSSIIDDDNDCRTNGCAIISYGAGNFIIYDNVNADGSEVNAGEPMVPRMTSPGIVNVTGTLNAATVPDLNEGVLLGFTEDGTSISQAVADVDMDGFLDAGDTMIGPYSVSATTDIILDPRSQRYSHSFFITSRNTRMSLRARVTEIEFTDDFAQTIAPSDILLTSSVTPQGSDGGFNFGTRANSGNVQINAAVNDLGDLSTLPTTMIEFDRQNGIGKPNGDLAEQSIRLDFEYTMPDYDFSLGKGSMMVKLEFDLYNEGSNNGNNGNGNNTDCSDTGNNGNSGNTCNNGNTGDNGNGGNNGNNGNR